MVQGLDFHTWYFKIKSHEKEYFNFIDPWSFGCFGK